MTSHLVIGAGEVGRAIAEVLGCPTRDIGDDPTLGWVDVIHVCFPYSDGFEEAVRGYQARYQPDLTVIHSTVPVGTSRRLGAVHSPVTGKHPRLAPSVRTFVKWFGGEQAGEAAAHFAAVGVPTRTTPWPETTEAGKLWQTLQFGLLVAIEKECVAFCEAVGADPDIAYAEFNRTYSEGYAAMGEPFRLPVLAHVPGPIGGHCVIPNAHLTPAPLADMLIDLDRAWACE